MTRTLDLRIRNPLLYPAELRAQLATAILRCVREEIQWIVKALEC